IVNDHGLSKPFTELSPSQRLSFDATKISSVIGLNSNSELVLIGAENDQLGEVHYRYYQTYLGNPVENSMYIVHTKDGMIKGMSGSIVMNFDPQTALNKSAPLKQTKAIQAAVEYVNAEKYMWQDQVMEQRLKNQTGNSGASYYPTASLVWYNAGDAIDPGSLKLAYKVDVYAQQPMTRADIFVDAQTGNILGTSDRLYHSDATGTAATAYSGTQTIHSDLSGSNYRLRDYTKGNGIITLKSSGSDYSSSSANWTTTGQDKYALDAHYGVSSTYSFYLANFNRNSLNNAGIALYSYVNDPSQNFNAGWDGSEMLFGNLGSGGAGITAIDVCGHELTHGVTQYTCNLNYSNQSGAMNESLSDIMGKSVQFWAKPTDINWLLSNDMNWGIRNMSNPGAFNQPDTYLGSHWTTSSADNGGVHTNSGVGNFMFYLLVTGGSGTNDIGNAYTVTGIGLSEADQIIYRTQTVYLTKTSQYADWRTACINAATDLYGSSSNEVIQVKNAWYAVGIGTSGGTSCGIPGGLNATSITNTSATLNWTAVSGATSYNVQYRPVGSSTWSSTTSTTVSKTVSTLTIATQYEFQVQTVCSGGTSSFSGSVNFTTGATVCAESLEPNNTKNTAAAIAVNVDIKSQISTSTDVDWLSFTNSSTAKNIKVTLTNLPANYNLSFYDAAGTLVASSKKGGLNDESIIYNTSVIGTYVVKVIGASGAFNNTQCYTLHAYTSNTAFRLDEGQGLVAGDATTMFTLYPNPASDHLNMQYDGTDETDATIRILNMLGQTISVSVQHVAPGEIVPLNISSLANGKYLVGFTTNNQQGVKMIEIIR
ncbi:MAG: M4 family metallopeptidase, partial [Chitinophagales bacterium]